MDIPSQGHADRLPEVFRGATYRGTPQRQSPHRPLALGHYPGTSPSRTDSPSPPRYKQGGTSPSRDKLVEEKRHRGTTDGRRGSGGGEEPRNPHINITVKR